MIRSPFNLASIFRANPPSQPQPMTPTLGTAISGMFPGGIPNQGPRIMNEPTFTPSPGMGLIPRGLGVGAPRIMNEPTFTPPPGAALIPPGGTGGIRKVGTANALARMPSQAKAYGLRGLRP